MHLKKSDIEKLDKIKRLNIINSITGIKPANLIGTLSEDGIPNLAIFNSAVHIGSNPALIAFILRPRGEVIRHTYENIQRTGYYTINHVHQSFVEKAHYTSAKFDQDTSEFETCRLTEEYLFNFNAPFVKESQLKMGMEFIEEIPIKLNGTLMAIGAVQHIVLPDQIMDTEGHCDLAKINDVGISGLNSYYALEKIAKFPYARAHELPDFKKK